MSCETCNNFPFPESNFEVLEGGEEGRGTSYRCKQCGTLFEVIEEGRGVRITLKEKVQWERTVIVSDEPVKTKPSRVLKEVGFVLLGLLSSIPGLFVITLGVRGLLSGRMTGSRKFGGGPMFGEEAIGWAWIHIGFGLWGLGYLGTFCSRWRLLKMFLYVLAGGAFAWGIVKLIRHMF